MSTDSEDASLHTAMRINVVLTNVCRGTAFLGSDGLDVVTNLNHEAERVWIQTLPLVPLLAVERECVIPVPRLPSGGRLEETPEPKIGGRLNAKEAHGCSSVEGVWKVGEGIWHEKRKKT